MASEVKATYLTSSGTVFAGRARIKAIHYIVLLMSSEDKNEKWSVDGFLNKKED